jgi:hypothetical protein
MGIIVFVFVLHQGGEPRGPLEFPRCPRGLSDVEPSADLALTIGLITLSNHDSVQASVNASCPFDSMEHYLQASP